MAARRTRAAGIPPPSPVDNTAPTITLTNPGTPLGGTVTLASTTGDGAGSGVTSVAYAVLGLVALGLAFAPSGEGAPKLRPASASGALTLSNSKEGAAIFHADATRPGREASGSVTITNTGTVDAALTLAPEATGDTPGNGGGKLSNKLEVLVIDVTAVSMPMTVYAGTLKEMTATNVGSLAPGGHRTYVFVASLRPNGSADNAFQGAALTTGFRWSATGIATATPTPTPSPTPMATPAPAATPEPTAPPAPGARLKGVKAKKVKAKVNLKGLPAGKVTVTITAVMSTGRKAVSTGTYRTSAAEKKPARKKRKR